jgi:MYXO-CTERM domain-containing protein
MKNTYIFGFSLLTLVTSASASAHVEMLTPTPRLAGQAGGNQIKEKPCGQDVNMRTTDKVTTFKPGQTIEIKMKEYVPHPGYYAVGFDPEGDDSLPFPLAEELANSSKDNPMSLVNGTTILGVRADTPDCNKEPDQTCTLSITLPNMQCENCTLQLIQFMTDKSIAQAYYYQCADIKLAGDPAPAGGAGGGGAGGASGGGAGGGSSGRGGSGGNLGSGGVAAGAGGALMAGAAGAPTAGAAGAASAGAASAGTGSVPTAPQAEDEAGCGVARHESGAASAFAALGLLLAFGTRRRRVLH